MSTIAFCKLENDEVMKKKGQLGRVLFILGADKKKQHGASAIYGSFLEETGERDRKKVQSVGHALFSMIPSRL